MSRSTSAKHGKTESTMELTEFKEKELTDVFEESRGLRRQGKASKRKRKSKFMFPWWCRYVAWFFCLASIFVSIFFIWAYGVQFGDEKTRKWITSLLVSFFMSVLVTQPIKVYRFP